MKRKDDHDQRLEHLRPARSITLYPLAFLHLDGTARTSPCHSCSSLPLRWSCPPASVSPAPPSRSGTAMVRSGAGRDPASGWPGSPHARSTAAADQVIPVPVLRAEKRAITSSPCWVERAARCGPAMSSCAVRRSAAARMALPAAPGRALSAAPARRVTSPARWSGAATLCPGRAMMAGWSADRTQARPDPSLPDGSRS